jgi:endonuclease/exonuclease/phosphatase (EEP) superfamily protein YafD
MGAWESSIYAVELIAAVLLVLALRWAARARAQAHRTWATLQAEVRKTGHVVIHWCMAWTMVGCL